MRFATYVILALAAVLSCGTAAPGQSLWERRDPKTANLFWDYRARLPGDVLTIVVSEVTNFEGQETRNLEKKTNATATVNGSGTSSVGGSGTKQFTANVTGGALSDRKFDGQANSTIDRKFLDKMSVIVVAVYPNGNLLIEGHRGRVVSRETRTLKVTGIVRPGDIGPNNQVQSQFIANFTVSYEGRGPDTNYSNQGWGGRVMNVLWPF
jgi:flagellar L-ring protein precursor FlgH